MQPSQHTAPNTNRGNVRAGYALSFAVRKFAWPETCFLDRDYTRPEETTREQEKPSLSREPIFFLHNLSFVCHLERSIRAQARECAVERPHDSRLDLTLANFLTVHPAKKISASQKSLSPRPSLRAGPELAEGDCLGKPQSTGYRIQPHHSSHTTLPVHPQRRTYQSRKPRTASRRCSLTQAPRKPFTVQQNSGIAEFLTSTQSQENLGQALQLTIILQINCISKTNVLISPSASR